MGRHSASSDDEDAAAVAAVADESAAVLTGRHARVEPPPAPEPDEEPHVALDEVDPDDGPLGLIAEQMTEPDEPPAAMAEPVSEPSGPAEATETGEATETAEATTAVSEPTGKKAERGNRSTAADLALLRQHSEVRARVIAAVVVPFLLYTAVLYLIGGLGRYLIWIAIPLVSAGVVAGFILDAEHRRRTGPSDG
ncbi:MAG: hypothetical protein ABR571_12400 [Jatrophihabitans sp.]|uniref:hypothetical protein n=1 Tax=Jatrophihabitans sp. TaxID=1932789 RepID=UPI003914B5E3